MDTLSCDLNINRIFTVTTLILDLKSFIIYFIYRKNMMNQSTEPYCNTYFKTGGGSPKCDFTKKKKEIMLIKTYYYY